VELCGVFTTLQAGMSTVILEKLEKEEVERKSKNVSLHNIYYQTLDKLDSDAIEQVFLPHKDFYQLR